MAQKKSRAAESASRKSDAARMIDERTKLTRAEASALIADLTEEEKRMLAEMLARLKNGQN